MFAVSWALCGLMLATSGALAGAQTPSATEYRFAFPDAVHHVMAVEATFHDVPQGLFRVEMSRSSPGRYAAFEFASNVFEEQFTDGAGKPLAVTKPDPRSWTVMSDDGTVRVRYELFGDKVDGTFMAVDTTHAHLNLPATVMWAEGFDDRAVQVSVALPAGLGWKIATQLYPTADAQVFTAPNLQYLMDSPVELSNFVLRTFAVAPLQAGGKTETIRVVAHSQATDAEFDTYFAGVQKLVREEQAVFGELPEYEPGSYTFLADALPWDGGDGMEHRNSTVMTGRRLSLDTAAHEYFHNWNVKRIRPAGLEPFNFRDVNMSDEMYFAEGFTQYYGELAMLRTGLTPDEDLRGLVGNVDYVVHAPGGKYRSALDMSRLAPLVDGASDQFPAYWSNDFVSYYSYGAAVAMGLDLQLRAKTNSRVTLDDLMRAMWVHFGKPGGPAPGLVGKPYTLADVQTQLAAVSGDPAFAADFAKRYIAGTEKIDYAPLLLRAGFILRAKDGPATMGPVRLAKGDGGCRVVGSTIIGSPLYAAGVDLDDEIVSVAGLPLGAPEDLAKALAGHKAGESVPVVFRRRGQETRANVSLMAPTTLEAVPVESTGAALSPEQKSFRKAWLASKVK